MVVALETFVKQITDSGIIAPGKLKNFVPPNAQPKDAQELARQLVQSKQLTKHQVQEIYAGRGKSLILGNYTILDRIGAGGMGQVFKAQHRRMDRTVAIKMLPTAMTKDAVAAARFEREVRAAAKLRHPNIVAADDADEAGGVHFLVMEYVEGSDLSALVKKNGPLPVANAVSYILQAARGLEFAHGEGVVHRDIKPANLLLDKKGCVKILDMGLARLNAEGDTATQAELTGTGAVMGTVDYMSPEQALNTKHADHRADIYSLGITLYYLLAGKAAYGGESLMEKLLAHREQPIPSLKAVQAGVPELLQAVFNKMVAKKIEDRYQSMSEAIADLERCQAGIGSSSASATVNTSLSPDTKTSAFGNRRLQLISAVESYEKPSGKGPPWKNTKLLAGAGAAGFLFVLLGVIVIFRNQKGEEVGRIELPPDITAEVQAGGANPAHAPDAGAAQAGKPITTPADPAFQQWVKEVASLPAEKQVDAVAKKLVELNPGFDGKVTDVSGRGTPKIENGTVTELVFFTDNVSDISPVRPLSGLKTLKCSGSNLGQGRLSDASPLAGMNELKYLALNDTEVTDDGLARIGFLPKLKILHLARTKITDASLEFISQMPTITQLWLSGTRISDRGVKHLLRLTNLDYLALDRSAITDESLTYVHALTKMQYLDLTKTAITDSGLPSLESLTAMLSVDLRGNDKLTPAAVAALRRALPNKVEWNEPAKGPPSPPASAVNPGRPITTAADPAFQQWVKEVAALPAEQQTDAVSKKLVELNPGFDGKVKPGIKHGTVTTLEFLTDNVTDISPVRALTDLKTLDCSGTYIGKGKLADLSPLRGMDLTSLIFRYNPLTDLSPLKGLPLTNLNLQVTPVSDLSPLAGMPLTTLVIERTSVFDLSPLRGMRLNTLNAGNTKVSDLSPLSGMPLTELTCQNAPVTDLSPLKGMPLSGLECGGSKVSDLSPIAGMKLREVRCPSTKVTDLSPLAGCPNLNHVNATGNKIQAADVAALQRALPNCKIEWDGASKGPATPAAAPAASDRPITTPADPAFQQWVKDVAALHADGQVEAVRKKLMELNPGFDGKVAGYDGRSAPTVENGVVTDFRFSTDNVADISPLRALTGLKVLVANSRLPDMSVMSDLSPLKGIPLTVLHIAGTKVSDLSPLKGMPLTVIFCQGTGVADLSPLTGMPLTSLNLLNTKVTDLSPLKGMQLATIHVNYTKVSDLSPLRGMRLNNLSCGAAVSDLSPLQGMPLVLLDCSLSQVSDLSPLQDCKDLISLIVTKTKVTAAGVAALQKAVPNCKIQWDGGKPASPIDVGAKPTTPLPARVGPAPPLAKAPFDAAQAKAHQGAWARHLGTTVETVNRVGAKMILIPPGEFLMGSSDEQVEAALKVVAEIKADGGVKDRIQKAERPQHRVVITKPLLMGATEVTIGQFKKFAAATGYQTEAEKADVAAKAAPPQAPAPGQPAPAAPKPVLTYLSPGYAVTDDSPAAVITWNDAVAYCKWLSDDEQATYRLPTEAEWEYACRAGTTTQYSFGDDYAELEKYGWYNKNAGGNSHPVGTKLPNAFGLYDIQGNLEEWCQDFHDEKWYEKRLPNDPSGPDSGSYRVIRGGNWYNYASYCRSAARNLVAPSYRSYGHGFRPVRSW